MIVEAVGASVVVAITSLIGVFFFGSSKVLAGIQKYVVPVAVGLFLSLVLFELVPETLESAPVFGGIAVALGFLSFFVLSAMLHNKYHTLEEEDCDQKRAATLLLVGDTIHNLADGVILGGAFLIDPSIGIATAIGLALHEIPQEIIEFGVLIRSGYSRTKAAVLNLFSASSIVVGTLLILIVAHHAEDYIWILTGVAAGNLLFLAASDLMPRIHDDLKQYGSVWKSTLSIFLGFSLMTGTLLWTHEQFGHGHSHEHEHEHSEEAHKTIDEAHTDVL